MTRTTRILCDACQSDITTTDGMPRFRLSLTCEALPNTADYEFSVNVFPPIEGRMDFCGLSCLETWLTRTKP